MRIADVMDELGKAVDMIDGLRVFPYWVDKITPPAAVVSWPTPLEYDTTYQRGGDKAEFPLTVLVGRVNARASRDTLSKYLNGEGVSSIKQAIENHPSSAWDSARVTKAEVAAISIAGVEYLGAEFTIDIIGRA